MGPSECSVCCFANPSHPNPPKQQTLTGRILSTSFILVLTATHLTTGETETQRGQITESHTVTLQTLNGLTPEAQGCSAFPERPRTQRQMR